MIEAPADVVEVGFPADTVNMAIARTVAAAVAARAELTVDQIDDVRLAVDEGVGYLISHATTDARVLGNLWVEEAEFHVLLSCPTANTEPPEPEVFSWTVLTALVGDVQTRIVDGELTMQWSLARDHSVSA